MLSERQDTVSIYHWLSEWIKNGAPIPKEAVTDMSLALLSAVVRAFTEFSNLNQYIEECSKILTNPSTIQIPRCFLRSDVAHVMKNVSMWKALRDKGFRTRQFYLRSMALVIQVTELSELKKLLGAICTVALSETEGKLDNGNDTKCEIEKSMLKKMIASGAIFCSVEEEPISSIEMDFECADNLEQNDLSPFEILVSSIIDECLGISEIEEGDHDNLQHVPEVIIEIKRLSKTIPIWTALMVPVFGYGSATSSSASSESSFNDIKHRVFQHLTLPIRVDQFIETHIMSLEGTMKLVAAKHVSMSRDAQCSPLASEDYCDGLDSQSGEPIGLAKDTNITPKKRPLIFEKIDEMATETQSQSININNTKRTNCIACENGDMPTGAHRCKICAIPVHIFNECSKPIDGEAEEEGYGQARLCLKCFECKKYLAEDNAIENWGGLASKRPKRTKKSYLESCPEFELIDFSKKTTKKPLGLLRNGSSTGNKTSLLTTVLKGTRMSISNTCPFDSIVQLLCSAYCDSEKYRGIIDGSGDAMLTFSLVRRMCRNGVTAQSYKLRAEILKLHFDCVKLPSGVVHISAETSVKSLASKLLLEFPSLIETSSCTESSCVGNRVFQRVTLGVELEYEDLNTLHSLELKLQRIIINYQGPCTYNECIGELTIVTSTPNTHLIIEVLVLNSKATSETDIANEFDIQLDKIPKHLNISGAKFELRGIVGYFGGSKRITSVGHYVAFCRRSDNCWEIYNDLATKKSPCAKSSRQNCHLIFYSI